MTANGIPDLSVAEVVLPSEHHHSPRTLTYAQFIDNAERELQRTRKCLGSRFDLLCIEPDCYMAAATASGGTAADRLSIAAIEHISILLWPRDAIVYIGGGRIAVLLETQSVARTTADFVEDMQCHLMSGFFHEDREIRTTASVGIAHLTGTYHRAAGVVDDAGAALDRAQREGRARAVTFTQFVDRWLTDTFEFGPDGLLRSTEMSSRCTTSR